MEEQMEVDRGAIVATYKQQNLDALNAAVHCGQWTQEEADQAHAAFMRSVLLDSLVSGDVEALMAMLKGQVH